MVSFSTKNALSFSMANVYSHEKSIIYFETKNRFKRSFLEASYNIIVTAEYNFKIFTSADWSFKNVLLHSNSTHFKPEPLIKDVLYSHTLCVINWFEVVGWAICGLCKCTVFQKLSRYFHILLLYLGNCVVDPAELEAELWYPPLWCPFIRGCLWCVDRFEYRLDGRAGTP